MGFIGKLAVGLGIYVAGYAVGVLGAAKVRGEDFFELNDKIMKRCKDDIRDCAQQIRNEIEAPDGRAQAQE